MTWLSALPVVLVAGVWVVGPGILLGFAAGLRGLLAWGTAPLLSVALIAGSAVVAGEIGTPWGVLVPLVATVVAASVLAGARWSLGRVRLRGDTRASASAPRRALGRRHPSADTPRSGAAPWSTAAQRGTDRASRRRVPWLALAAIVGMTVAVLLGWITLVRGLSGPEALSQTYDAVFHYSAVEYILTTHNGSSTVLGTLTNPDAAFSFYPGAWHDLVSLVASSGGRGDVVVSTNVTALVVAVVAWPLSCLALTRQVFGRSAASALLTPVLAIGFTAFPWRLMTFGVLWPNLLGVALLPAALAAVITLCGLARGGRPDRVAAAGVAAISLPALGLAHPNAVFSLAVLALFPLLWLLAHLVRAHLLTRRWYVPVLAVAVAGSALGALGWLVIASPFLASVRAFDWPAFSSPAGAAYDVLTNGTNGRPEAWAVSLLVLLGALFALRRAVTSWLVPAHAVSGLLYLLAAAQETDLSAALTGPWYNDSYRLAAMVPITGVALAVLGLRGIAELTRRAAASLRVAPAARRAIPATVTAGVALVLVGLTGYGQSVHAVTLASSYQGSTEVLLAPDHRSFLDDVGRRLPEDAVVASNPFTGNALLYPLTGQRVLFPHMTGNWTPDQRVVATRLRDVATDPAVCAAVRASGTTHVLTGPVTFRSGHPQARAFPGTNNLSGAPGFRLMADGGRTQLYRITACGLDGPTRE